MIPTLNTIISRNFFPFCRYSAASAQVEILPQGSWVRSQPQRFLTTFGKKIVPNFWVTPPSVTHRYPGSTPEWGVFFGVSEDLEVFFTVFLTKIGCSPRLPTVTQPPKNLKSPLTRVHPNVVCSKHSVFPEILVTRNTQFSRVE